MKIFSKFIQFNNICLHLTVFFCFLLNYKKLQKFFIHINYLIQFIMCKNYQTVKNDMFFKNKN